MSSVFLLSFSFSALFSFLANGFNHQSIFGGVFNERSVLNGHPIFCPTADEHGCFFLYSTLKPPSFTTGFDDPLGKPTWE